HQPVWRYFISQVSKTHHISLHDGRHSFVGHRAFFAAALLVNPWLLLLVKHLSRSPARGGHAIPQISSCDPLPVPRLLHESRSFGTGPAIGPTQISGSALRSPGDFPPARTRGQRSFHLRRLDADRHQGTAESR